MARMLEKHHDLILHGLPESYRKALLRHLVCVDVTNVARWFYEEDDQEVWDHREDFPCIAPPWPIGWFEFRNHGLTTRLGVTLPREIRTVGLRTFSLRIRDGMGQSAIQNDVLLQFIAESVAAVRPEAEIYRDPRREAAMKRAAAEGVAAGWACSYGIIWDVVGKPPLPLATWCMYLDEQGRALNKLSSVIPNPLVADEYNETGGYLLPFFFALSLLHCKNVTLVDLPGPPPQVRKKRQKKGRPILRYKELVVEPMRKQVRRERSEDGAGGRAGEIKQALHVCRGHFKDYRDGPGLFGKYQGMWWWEPHVRGSAEAGMVHKDYRVTMDRNRQRKRRRRKRR